MEEKWKQIDGFEKYEVSNYGNVRRKLRDNKYRELKKDIKRSGHVQIELWKNNICSKRLIHRLVANAFVDGKTLNSDVVDHIDGNSGNNNASNLRWVCTLVNNGNRNQYLLKMVEYICALHSQGRTPDEILPLLK